MFSHFRAQRLKRLQGKGYGTVVGLLEKVELFIPIFLVVTL